MKHTPGPWELESDENKQGYVNGYFIAPKKLPTLAHVYNYPEETEANTQLIAAAPELKEYGYNLAMIALQSDFYLRPDVREAVDKLLAIYKRIEGR